MPVYEYKCNTCGERFELRRSMIDVDDEVKCPKCGAQRPQRLFSVFGVASSGPGAVPSDQACSKSSFS